MLFSSSLISSCLLIFSLLFMPSNSAFGYNFDGLSKQASEPISDLIYSSANYNNIQNIPYFLFPFQMGVPFREHLTVEFTPSPATKETNLTITEVAPSMFRMQGSSNNFTGAFISQPLEYKGQNLSLSLGNVAKDSIRDFQISFNYYVEGTRDNYTITYVHGPLTVQGWKDNQYYEKIDTNTTRSVNLADVITSNGDNYVSLKKVVVAMSRNSTLDSIEFMIRV